MERTSKTMRRSIHRFLQQYSYFTSTSSLFIFPFSISILLSQIFVPNSSVFTSTHHLLHSLFIAAGFPHSSEFFTVLNLKLAQTISSFIFSLPFSLTFFLIGKSSVIHALNHKKQSIPSLFSSILSLYTPLLRTHVWNSLFIVSANSFCLTILIFLFNTFDGSGFSSPNFLLFLSASGAVLYSIILANSLIISNLSLVLSGFEENCNGYLAILRGCVLIRGKTSTALSLALPTNLVLAAIEALFHYRVVRAYHISSNLSSSVVFEGLFIAYLHAIFIVVDTIVSCEFYRSCKQSCNFDQEEEDILCSYRVGIEAGDVTYVIVKSVELP